jgi:hypothetical protein
MVIRNISEPKVPYGGVGQSRIPGSMEGEIWMAPDFDELPDDMAEAFGMIEPGK